MAMVLFTKHIWPLPSAMWFSSYCYPMIERVLRWRLTQREVNSILPCDFQPSELQLTTSHSTIIDWIACPPLRDRFIQHFNQTVLLDRVFIELMEHAVVEVADISTILSGVRKGPGFLGVCNLYHAMSSADIGIYADTICNDDGLELKDISLTGMLQVYKMPLPPMFNICRKQCSGQGKWEPVPLAQLLASRDLALKLYYHLSLHEAHESWRIDPSFYEKYPELKWESYEATVARGVSYRLSQDWVRLSTVNLGM